MSEPSGPQGKSGPGKPPDGRRGADAALEGADLDFEPDALLDTLLADPFPSAQGTPTARPPKPIPFETDSLHDDVTVVGQGIDELLAQSFSDSGPPPPPSVLAPPPAMGAPPTIPRIAPPTAPPRPAAPPRPGVPGPPRPRSISEAGPSRVVKAPETPVVPPPQLEAELAAHASASPQFEDEETRVLRLPSELGTHAQNLAVAIPTPKAPSPPGQPSEPPGAELVLGEDEFTTIRDSVAPEAPDADGDAESSEAPTRPPQSGGGDARVPLAPRVPNLPTPFTQQARPATLPSSPAPASPSARPSVQVQSTTLEPGASTSSLPPSGVGVAALDGPIDPIAREAWITRAEWLESEAHTAADPQAKARALLIASELWAIIGDIGRAREVALEASAIARTMTMVGRQLRWLAALEEDWKSVASLLELETRSAATPEARLHAAYLCAEVYRLQLDDRDAAKKKLDLCVRAQPEDARAHVMRIAEQLAASNAAPKLRLPEAPELSELSRALEALGTLRAPTTGGGTPLAAFEEARRALAAGNRAQAASALLRLAELPGLAQAARWLSASLLAQESDQRTEAIPVLEPLLSSAAGESARRALAARALETALPEGLSRSLADGGSAFSAADRVALSALSGSELADFELVVAELTQSPGKRALAAAAVLAGPLTSTAEPRAGSEQAQTALKIGRLIARPPRDAGDGLDYLKPSVDAFREQRPEHALGRVLGLELALSRRDENEVATHLAEWPHASNDAEGARDAELASALVHELAGNASAAKSAYERALVAAPTSEFACRALLGSAEGTAAADLVERLADAEGSGTVAALHFMEAALRRGTDDAAAFDALLEKAVQADSKLAVPYRLGEQLASRQGEKERLLYWLRARRAIASDPLELTLDLVREAQLVAQSSAETASALLKEALEARPADGALWELYERLSGNAELGQAGWREAAAARNSDLAKQRLLAEAAEVHERANNHEAAVQALRGALEANPSGALVKVMLERLAPGTSESTRLADEFIARAKASDDEREQRELYERLFELDRARGDGSAALFWQNAILERSPRYLPALRRLEATHIAADRTEELEPVETALAEALSGSDATSAARLSSRLRLAAGNWAGARKIAEIALREEPSALWALRMLSAQARVADQPEIVLDTERRLNELCSRPLDKATLALRASESAARLQRWEDAQTLLEQALEQVPDHLVALTTLAAVLEAREDFAAAARTLETVAETSQVDAHRVAALYQAGVIWLDKAHNPEQGRATLERAVDLDLSHEEAVSRLQALYVARGDRQKLAELLARRLERTTDPEERIAIEVTRGRALAEVGEPAAARAALAAALDANPDHIEALETFAEVCLTEGDWLGAEQAFIRLARHSADPAQQAQIYRRLGELYDTTIPNAERAELAYQEVLKRDPDDDSAVDRLIAVYARLGAKERAVQVQTQLLERSTSPEQRRERVLRLAIVFEQVAGQPKQAEAVLERARKEWPHEAQVLRALVELQQRNGESRAAQVLLDRATADCRRALGTGRFEPALFDILATVASLKGATDSAAVAQATLAALTGEEHPLLGAGPAAGSAQLDDLLAPDLLAPGLRTLLRRTGDILDAAYPVDIRNLKASPLPAESAGYQAYVQDVARAFGFPSVHVLASPVLGATCLPASSSPPSLVFGQALLESQDHAARYCLLVRALKVLQGRAATVARTAPIDLWPLMAGLLGLLAPGWTAQGVDARKLAEARTRIQAVMPKSVEDDLPTLALEVTGLIGNRASQLATAVYEWGNRTALLAVGDPLAALRSIALTTGGAGPAASGPERIKWIVRNAEARDLAIFSVSEHYAEARRRLSVSAG
ncbi:MAG TPA: tetratricopeptide repeat protein [Polyangiaceae bacterium]|nr:tetratricopeptide repeat protein [Polyangiaceae bacterium]